MNDRPDVDGTDSNMIQMDDMEINSKGIGKPSVLRRSNRIKDIPRVSYNENEIDPDNYIMIAQSIICEVPHSYDEIRYRDDRNKWEQAIKKERNSLISNNTWCLVPRPKNKNIVDCK